MGMGSFIDVFLWNAAQSYQQLTTGLINDTSWHQIVLVRNGDAARMFVDDSLHFILNLPQGYGINNSAQNFAVGSAGDCPDSGYFNGWIDEFRISKGIARW